MSIIFIVLLLVGLFFAFNQAKIKGIIGEKKLSSLLLFLDKDVYQTYNNLYIETSRGIYQIDHIVVSRYGIFVIETKSYKGTISGSYKSKKWTQNIWDNKITNYLRYGKR